MRLGWKAGLEGLGGTTGGTPQFQCKGVRERRVTAGSGGGNSRMPKKDMTQDVDFSFVVLL